MRPVPERFAIAIDGPASSGKGTVARLVARRLGFAYVDTGAMYRVVALRAQRAGVSWDDEPALGATAAALSFDFAWDGQRLRVVCDGEDLSSAIRTESVGQGASAVARHPSVRSALLELQRQLADRRGVVVDGRDIGTVVLPQAPLKVFLDASVDERARRRHAEQGGRGVEVSFAQVRAELVARDAQDSGRSAAPLRQADDAWYVDTTGLSPDAIAARIVEEARRRGA